MEASSAKNVRSWRTLLPDEMKNNPMACINNIAFAFCRMSHPQNAKMRLYWWVALAKEGRNNQPHILGLNRVR